MIKAIKGEKYGGMMGSEDKMMYPHFSVATKHLPEAKKWEIDGVYDVTIRIKQTSIGRHTASFDVVGIESHGESKHNPGKHSRMKKGKTYA